MRIPHVRRGVLAAVVAQFILFAVGTAAASPSDLQQTSPLVWVMIAISLGGAILVYAFLAYALWKHRDPKARGRRYG